MVPESPFSIGALELGLRGPLWHLLFEALAYSMGFALFRWQRIRHDFLSAPTRWSLVVAAILGAVVGSKLLHHLANPARWALYPDAPWLLLGGKTIVGALLGGWIAVELIKKRLGLKERTGDVYVAPLILGMAVGRVGCFLAGLSDGTYGRPTDWPWAVDFGDGVQRHPTQLYEILFLVILAWVLFRRRLTPDAPQGILFRGFMVAYLAFRLLIDWLKPYDLIFGMNPIQWTCLIALCFVYRDIVPITRTFGPQGWSSKARKGAP